MTIKEFVALRTKYYEKIKDKAKENNCTVEEYYFLSFIKFMRSRYTKIENKKIIILDKYKQTITNIVLKYYNEKRKKDNETFNLFLSIVMQRPVTFGNITNIFFKKNEIVNE